MTSGPAHDDAPRLHPHPVFEVSEPQMSGGERAALEGVLAQLRPRLAIEIGTAEGATLGRIAAHAGEVHSFDLFEPVLETGRLANVVLHTGDSHELLPRGLARLARDGRNVDFVLVDGDHSADGVRRDLEDLLASDALATTTILIHDTSNPTVRRGLDAVDWAAHAKVAEVDLDWLSGYLFTNPHFRHELWGGIGRIVVDAAADRTGSPLQERYVPIGPLLEWARRAVDEGETPADVDALRARLDHAENATREKLARGDAEHEMRVAAQRRVAELEQRLRRRTPRGMLDAALAAWRRGGASQK
jgi:hypothetical protein